MQCIAEETSIGLKVRCIKHSEQTCPKFPLGFASSRPRNRETTLAIKIVGNKHHGSFRKVFRQGASILLPSAQSSPPWKACGPANQFLHSCACASNSGVVADDGLRHGAEQFANDFR